ncbi:MAG: hypothetical protein RLZZ153_967 [Pseudomonadota bacterium]|jgi:hypothetical protein
MSISTGLVGLGGHHIATGNGQDSFEYNFRSALMAAQQPADGDRAASAADRPHGNNRSRRILRALVDESRGTGRYVKLVGTTNREGGMRLIYHGKTRHWFSRGTKIHNTNTALIELARSAFKTAGEAEQSPAFQKLEAYLQQRRVLRRAPKPEAIRPYLRELLREISPADAPVAPANSLYRLGHRVASEADIQGLRQHLATPQAWDGSRIPLGLTLSAKALARTVESEFPAGINAGQLEQRITHLLKGSAASAPSQVDINALITDHLTRPGESPPTAERLSNKPVLRADWVERGEDIVLRIECYDSYAIRAPGPNPAQYLLQHKTHTLNPVHRMVNRRMGWYLQATLRTRFALEIPVTYLTSAQRWPPNADDPQIRAVSTEYDLRLGDTDKWPQPPELGNTFPLTQPSMLVGSLHGSVIEAGKRHGKPAYNSMIEQVQNALPGGDQLKDIDCENLSVRASQRLSEADRALALLVEDLARQAYLDAHHEVDAEGAALQQMRASIAPGTDSISARFQPDLAQQAGPGVVKVDAAQAHARPPAIEPAQASNARPAILEFLAQIDAIEARHNAIRNPDDSTWLTPGFLRRHFGALLSPTDIDLQRPGDAARPLILVGDADGSLLRLALAAWSAGYWQPNAAEQQPMLQLLLEEGVAMHRRSPTSLKEYQEDPILHGWLGGMATAIEASMTSQIEHGDAMPAQQLVFMGDILSDRLSNHGEALERVIRALHRRGAVFLRGNHDVAADWLDENIGPAIGCQWGAYARQKLSSEAAQRLLNDCFVNAWTDETRSIVLTHNGFFYDPRTDAWHTAVGAIPARDASGQVKSVQAFVEAMNDEAMKAETVSTDFRPKAFIQGVDQLRPRNERGPLPWVGHGHDGDCGLNNGRGVLNLNARADGDFIAVGVRVI